MFGDTPQHVEHISRRERSAVADRSCSGLVGIDAGVGYLPNMPSLLTLVFLPALTP